MAAAAVGEPPPASEMFGGGSGPEVSDLDAMVQRLKTPRTVDEQLTEQAEKLREVKAMQKKVEEAVGASASMPVPKTMASSVWRPTNQRQKPGDAYRWLKLLEDPQFLELCEKAEQDGPASEDEAPLRLDWRRHCRRGIRALLEQLRMTQDPRAAERQLRAAYRWYQLQAGAGAFQKAHSSAETQGGGDFHDPPPMDVTLIPGSSRYCPPESRGGPSSPTVAATPSGGQSRPALPSARDRLRDFETRQLVGPLSARKLKVAGWDGQSESGMRPETPSTTTGGFTARSFSRMASRPHSALSCQPPLSARAGLASRPRTASGMRTPSVQVDAFAREPPTPEEVRMEERWIAARNREVVEQIAGEERRAALREWSERRARVEEEIARNAEVSRFQSDLQRRGYEQPPDAHEDIDALVLAKQQERSGGGRPASAVPRPPSSMAATPRNGDAGSGSSSSKGSNGSELGEAASSREDAQVHFAEEAEVVGEDGQGLAPQRPPSRPALTPRLAQLRRIHARLLVRPEGEEVVMEEATAASAPEVQQPAMSTHVAGRMEDGSDIVAAVCEKWRDAHAPELELSSGTAMTHHQMRYQQLMEVEQVKRTFARRRMPVNEAALEGALVAPSRDLAGADATPLMTTPGGMRNPFHEGHKKKKKTKGKSKQRRRSSAKGSSKSRSPPAGQRRASSARR